MIQAGVGGRLDVVHLAAETGEILVERGERAHGGVLVVVEGIVAERVTDRRGEDRTLCQFAFDRERRFTVGVAVLRNPPGGTGTKAKYLSGVGKVLMKSGLMLLQFINCGGSEIDCR